MQVPLSGGRSARDWSALVREVVGVAREERITVTAASLAYYAFNSLLPFALLVVVGLATVGGIRSALGVAELLTGANLSSSASMAQSVVGDGTAGRPRAAAIALVILLWSALRMFRAMNEAFAAIYDTRAEESLVGTAVDVVIVFGTILLALGLLAVLGVALTFVVRGPAWAVVSPLVLFCGLVVVFFPMYYVFPEVDVTWREALPGAAFAAVAWTCSGLGFRLYANVSESVQLYGVVGGVLLLLTWLYVGGLVLLVGIVLNVVLADRGDPDGEWVPGEGTEG